MSEMRSDFDVISVGLDDYLVHGYTDFTMRNTTNPNPSTSQCELTYPAE